MKGSSLKLGLIPEQFTVKAHPALFEGKEGRGKEIEEHFPEASACGVFVGRRFRPVPKSPIFPAETSAFSRDSVGPWGGGKREEAGEGRGEQNWNEI